MDILDPLTIDEEAIESALKEIHYYINLPKHIKGRVTELKIIKPNDPNSTSVPAHVVNGTTTVIKGKINIPLLSHGMQFLRKTIS